MMRMSHVSHLAFLILVPAVCKLHMTCMLFWFALTSMSMATSAQPADILIWTDKQLFVKRCPDCEHCSVLSKALVFLSSIVLCRSVLDDVYISRVHTDVHQGVL